MPTLRIANVLHNEVEVLCIHHQGALYSVPELEHFYEVESSPARFAEASSFRRRVFSLGLAGLYELAEHLSESEPPSAALLDPCDCMFLTPTVANPALLEFDVRAEDPVPMFRRGFGRCLRGNEAPLPIPSDETAPELTVQIAAILGDDLRNASPEQAERAIIGYSILSLWTLPSRERLSPGWGRYRLGQLGPDLVVSEPGFDPSKCDIAISVNAERTVAARARPWRTSFSSMIAFACEGFDLLAGDVIATGPLARISSDGARSLRDDDRISVEVSHLGELSGVVVVSAPRCGAHCWAPAS